VIQKRIKVFVERYISSISRNKNWNTLLQLWPPQHCGSGCCRPTCLPLPHNMDLAST